MSTKHLTLAALLLATPFAVGATDLLCAGTAYTRGLSLKHELVVRFDSSSQRMTAKTFNGWAAGTVRAEPDLYLGYLDTANGHRYWVNLHRYSGELYLGLENGNQDKPEFFGKCSKAQRAF